VWYNSEDFKVCNIAGDRNIYRSVQSSSWWALPVRILTNDSGNGDCGDRDKPAPLADSCGLYTVYYISPLDFLCFTFPNFLLYNVTLNQFGYF
jgi:hypothetical protein